MTYADEIINRNEVSYLINKPVSIFHTYNIGLEQFNMWNLMALSWVQAGTIILC